jgi:hypothetical protein
MKTGTNINRQSGTFATKEFADRVESIRERYGSFSAYFKPRKFRKPPTKGSTPIAKEPKALACQ